MAKATRASAVYAAVHEQIMQARIELYRRWKNDARFERHADEWDVVIAQSMDAAARAAVAALSKPLRKQAVASGRARPVARKTAARAPRRKSKDTERGT